jgi:1-pyrroline-5-carboxylate dehydrogenase
MPGNTHPPSPSRELGLPAFNGTRRVPPPVNEAVKNYAPGSPERAELKDRLRQMAGERIEIPLVIGGKDARGESQETVSMPHDHRHVLADAHKASAAQVEEAIAAAGAAAHEWGSWPWEDRAAVFLKAAELLATRWRATANAATMLGQSKTAHQAEIDAAAELIDFWRFNPAYAQELYAEQPLSSGSMWNQTDLRPLEGFVYAITPFNFTSIAGNLPTAPALMGNTVVWKPASTAMLSAHYLLRLLMEAGLPPGVINLVPGDPGPISDVLLNHRDLAGIHFTGSTEVFNRIWSTVGQNIRNYRTYPRLVGETGGKDFIVAHPSADLASLAAAIVRGGFEFQGQKCSAASRLFIPASLWPELRERVRALMGELKMGDVADFRNFVGAVIDRKAFTRIAGYIAAARQAGDRIIGGTCDDSRGYFIEPTLVETADPKSKLLQEEIFGPIVTAYVYPDASWSDVLSLVDHGSPYALTGAVFARDRRAVKEALIALRNTAGNFYINDKPTGAVVGQQPFGGARASGTNDKAGSKLNLTRWASARTVKETFSPPIEVKYAFMDDE